MGVAAQTEIDRKPSFGSIGALEQATRFGAEIQYAGSLRIHLQKTRVGRLAGWQTDALGEESGAAVDTFEYRVATEAQHARVHILYNVV